MNDYKSRLLFLFVGLLIIGLIGYFLFRGQIIGYIFAHIGGVAVVGFLGMLAGYVAQKKGYSYKLAFNLGFTLSIVLGVIAVLVVYAVSESKHFACGGSVSLLISLIVIVVYMLFRKKGTVSN